jgi:hypothetical protein
VKTQSLRVAAAAAGLALLASGAASARTTGSAPSAIRISTTMSAAEEVPQPRGDVANARGTFSATVRRTATGFEMTWSMTFSGLTGRANAAHIHIAPRGEAGGVVVPLCAPCESPASGTTANVNATVVSALENGTAYVNMHTPTNGPGEIRGQLSIVANVRTSLNSRQEVPRPRGRVGRAGGTFTATVTKSGESAVVRWRLTFRRLTGRALAAHVHIGARGRAGRVAFTLCSRCRSGRSGRATVSGGALSALQAGRAYVNVHTRRNPGGEIRGQIRAVPLALSS